MIQLREQFGIILAEAEIKVLEGMGCKESDLLKFCEAMKGLGENVATMKHEILRDAYSLGLLARPEAERKAPAESGDPTQHEDHPARPVVDTSDLF